MAAPAWVAASTGTTDTGGAWTHTTNAPGAAERLIICHVFQDGTSANNAITITSATNCTALDGTANAFTPLAATGYPLGSTSSPTGYHYLFFARSTGTSAVVITGGNSGTNDIYVRCYEFSGVHAGVDLVHVIENGTAGAVASDANASTSVTDVAVTTLGTERLACNFIAVADEIQAGELTAMAGESGGDWTYPTAAFGTSTGTDGTLALVTATIANAGTIDGGSDAITSEQWGVIGFALRPTSAALVQYGALVISLTGGFTTNSTNVLRGTSTLALSAGFTTQGIRTGTGVSDSAYTASFTTSGTAETPTLSTTVARLSLQPGGIPATRTLHKIKIRARVTSGAGTIYAALYEGASNRSGDLSQELTTSLADYALAIPDANAEDITDYSDLEVRIWGEAAGAITFEVDQVSLETPVQTYSGASASTFTLDSTTQGKRALYGASTSSLSADLATQGKVTAKGAATQALSAGLTTQGKVTAKGSITQALTADFTTQGTRALRATSTAALTATFATSGRLEAKTAATQALSAGFATQGRVTAKGSAATSYTVDLTTSGTGSQGAQTFYGASVLDLTLTPTTNGTRTTFGKTTLPPWGGEPWGEGWSDLFGVEVTTRGRISAKAASTFALTWTFTTAGSSTAGAETYYGASVVDLTLGLTTNSLRTGRGFSTLPITLGLTTSGRLGARGAVALPLTLGSTSAARVTAHGTVVLPLTLAFTSDGTIAGQQSGASVLPLTLGITTSGIVTARSAVVLPLALASTTAGTRTTHGASALPLTLVLVTSGDRSALTLYGASVLPLSTALTASGSGLARGRSAVTLAVALTSDGHKTTWGTISLPLTLAYTSAGHADVFAQAEVLALLLGVYANGIRQGGTLTMLDVIYTGRIADTSVGAINGREYGHVSDTVAGVVEEDLEEVSA